MKKSTGHKIKLFHGALWAIGIGIAFLIGLALAVLAFNWLAQRNEKMPEITFVTPRQAIIFWETETPQIGYIKYGSNKYQLNQRVDQTSSVPSVTHAVVLDDLPLEGLYFSVHSESESRFLWRRVQQIHFDPSTLE